MSKTAINRLMGVTVLRLQRSIEKLKEDGKKPGFEEKHNE